MNISLNTHFEKFVAEVVASGRYKSSSEVVREGLRLLEEREAALIALRREIEIGRASGEPISGEDVFAEARARIDARIKRAGNE